MFPKLSRRDNKILLKTAQFAYDKLLVEKGDDNTIRQALREELNQIVTKGSTWRVKSICIDLDIVVDSLLDIAHRYSVRFVRGVYGAGVER